MMRTILVADPNGMFILFSNHRWTHALATFCILRTKPQLYCLLARLLPR